MSTPLRVSSSINRVMILCNNAYAPELNPQEHVWDELREKEFPNRVFDNRDRVREQLEVGLPLSLPTGKR